MSGIGKTTIAAHYDNDEMFLDIAFFFNATSGIEILEDKALITISNNSRIQMHDLLQKMAYDIVQEDYNDRGKRSRLRDAKDICDVLGNNKELVNLEAIDLSECKQLINIPDLSKPLRTHFILCYWIGAQNCKV
ncbi:disease resistance protein (TIR-NBS-LRR class) [Trifolium pratense]|uniref:Disease resistance protein (TIR-NBS-LRR class) n=1 Tax=Trifolium pratense TaxID=57577 RepID=A0A2K3MI53_TRIPR|nr:disease resistance protein (TIR-NBS-LRR class) [Trifolium pratense]